MLFLTIKCQSIENILSTSNIVSSTTNTVTSNDTFPPKQLAETYAKITQQVCVLDGNVFDFDLNICIKSIPLDDSNNCKGKNKRIDKIDNTCKTVYYSDLDFVSDLLSVYAPFAFKPDVKPKLANIRPCYGKFCYNNRNEEYEPGTYRIVYGNKEGGVCYCNTYEPIPYCSDSCDPDYYYSTEVFPPLSIYENIEQSDFDTTAVFTLEKESDSYKWCRCPIDIPETTTTASETVSTTTFTISTTDASQPTNIDTLPPKMLTKTYLKIAQQICILNGNTYDSNLDSCVKSVPLIDLGNCKGKGKWIDETDNTCKAIYNVNADFDSDLVSVNAPFAFKPDVEPKLANIPACYGTFCYNNWNEEYSPGTYRIVYGDKSGGVCYCKTYEPIPYCNESCDPEYYYSSEIFPPLSIYKNIKQSDFDTTAKFTLEKESDSLRWCRCQNEIPDTTTTSDTISTTAFTISTPDVSSTNVNTLPPKMLTKTYLKIAQQICIMNGNTYDSELDSCIKTVPSIDLSNCKGEGTWIDETDNTCKTIYNVSVDFESDLVSVNAPFAFKPGVEPELADIPACYGTFCYNNWNEEYSPGTYRIVYGDKSGGVCYCKTYEPIPYCNESCDPEYYYSSEIFPPLSIYKNIEQSDFDTTAKFTLEKESDSFKWCRCPTETPSIPTTTSKTVSTIPDATPTNIDTFPPKKLTETYLKIIQQICMLNGNDYDFDLNSCIKSMPLSDSNHCKNEGQWIDETDNTCKTVYNTDVGFVSDLVSVYAPFAFKPDVKPKLANVRPCYGKFCYNNRNEEYEPGTYRIVYGNKEGGVCYCNTYEPIPYCSESCDPDYYYSTEVFPPLSIYENIEQSDFDTTAVFTLEKESDSFRWCRCPIDVPETTTTIPETVSTTTFTISTTDASLPTNTDTPPPKMLTKTYLKIAQQICILNGNTFDSELDSCIKTVPSIDLSNCKGKGKWIDETDNTCKTLYNINADFDSDLVSVNAPFAFKPGVEPELADIPACYGTFCYNNWNEEYSPGTYRIVYGDKSGGVCYCKTYEPIPYCKNSCDPEYYYSSEVFPPLSIYKNIKQSDFDTTAKFTLEKESESLRWCRCPNETPSIPTTTSKTISTTTVTLSTTNALPTTTETFPPKKLTKTYLKIVQQICKLNGYEYDFDLNSCIQSVPLKESNNCEGERQWVDETDNTCKTVYDTDIDFVSDLVSVYEPFAFKPDVKPKLANIRPCYGKFCYNNRNEEYEPGTYRIVYGNKEGGVCYCNTYEPIPYCSESCDPDYYYSTEVFPPLSIYENIEQSDFDTTAVFTLEKESDSYRWCRCPDVTSSSSTITETTTTDISSTIPTTTKVPPVIKVSEQELTIRKRFCEISGGIFNSNKLVCVTSVPYTGSCNENQWFDKTDNTCKQEEEFGGRYGLIEPFEVPFAFKSGVKPRVSGFSKCKSKNYYLNERPGFYRIIYSTDNNNDGKDSSICIAESYVPVLSCGKPCDPKYTFTTSDYPPVFLYENIKPSDFDTKAQFSIDEVEKDWCKCTKVILNL